MYNAKHYVSPLPLIVLLSVHYDAQPTIVHTTALLILGAPNISGLKCDVLKM